MQRFFKATRGGVVFCSNCKCLTLGWVLNIFILACCCFPSQLKAQGHPEDKQASVTASSNAPDLQTILEKMAAHNRMRDEILTAYSVDREYEIENKRWNKKAKLTATMVFVAPDEKLFETTSFSGSGFLRKAVLNRLMETERQNARGAFRINSAISADNYSFEFIEEEVCEGRLTYVLHATPKIKNDVLFDGLVWIDGQDFAVTRIEGRPAKSPSFWIKSVNFQHEYAKFGSLWFPVINTSITSVRFFGATVAKITYRNYVINELWLLESAALMRKNPTQLETQMPPAANSNGDR
jgi:hypothetical protein